MNVSELIEELKRLPLDAPVRKWDYDRDEGWFLVDVEGANTTLNNEVVID